MIQAQLLQILILQSLKGILTFESVAVSLHTTRFNIQNFYMVIALC